MSLPILRLKKKEDRRVRFGHPWIYSNEIDVRVNPLKSFASGELVSVEAYDKSFLGIGYINPQSLIAVRLLTQNPDQNIDANFFASKLKQALLLRDSFFSSPFYRLAFSEADELPGLIIDRFDEHFVMQINTAGMERLTSLLIEALKTIFPKLKSITLRNDTTARNQENLPLEITTVVGDAPEITQLIENDVQFDVPLLSGQKTGWFYDHRMNRMRLKDYVRDKNVLDVFSYLGGWGIEAAVFGAKLVDCVESSSKAAEFIKRNAEKNHVANKVNVFCDDAFDVLKKLLQQKKLYDVIILDPPAFVKKAKDREEGLIAYQRINELALRLLNENGVLISCSCSMHVSLEDLKQILIRAAYRANVKLQLLEFGHQAPDHPIHFQIPETNYLKAIFARKLLHQ